MKTTIASLVAALTFVATIGFGGSADADSLPGDPLVTKGNEGGGNGSMGTAPAERTDKGAYEKSVTQGQATTAATQQQEASTQKQAETLGATVVKTPS